MPKKSPPPTPKKSSAKTSSFSSSTNPRTVVIFDTETTGLPIEGESNLDLQPAIIEVGAAIYNIDTREELATFSTLIDPLRPISEEITKITGIKSSDLIGQPTFAAVYPRLAEFFLGQRCLIAHNAPFDTTLLSFDLRRINALTAFPWPMEQYCTSTATAQVYGRRKRLKDWYAEKFPKVKREQTHRALDDVRMLAEALFADDAILKGVPV